MNRETEESLEEKENKPKLAKIFRNSKFKTHDIAIKKRIRM